MNLREKLKVILPDFLPANPAEAVKGTELIRSVKMRLREDYSDATLRYHFTIMCSDPKSPIAKVSQGQGYYLRKPSPIHSGGHGQRSAYQARLGLGNDSQPEVVDLAEVRQQKLRAIFFRMHEQAGDFPFLFESSFGEEAPYENVWKCPDAAVLDWELGEHLDSSFRLDPSVLTFKRQMGVNLFTLTSVKLKMEVTYDSFREDFFQTLSTSGWSHAGELVIAAPLSDHQLADELAELGAEHGIGISTLGVEMEQLDEWPPHWAIREMSEREFEAVMDKLQPQKIAPRRKARALSWNVLEAIRQDNADFQSLFAWLQRCLKDGRAHTFAEFVKISGEELLRGQ